MASDLTPYYLADALYECARSWPTSTLEKNGVGNLVVVADGAWIAWVDLYNGEVNEFTVTHIFGEPIGDTQA